jgi:hypothetical protein
VHFISSTIIYKHTHTYTHTHTHTHTHIYIYVERERDGGREGECVEKLLFEYVSSDENRKIRRKTRKMP